MDWSDEFTTNYGEKLLVNFCRFNYVFDLNIIVHIIEGKLIRNIINKLYLIDVLITSAAPKILKRFTGIC